MYKSLKFLFTLFPVLLVMSSCIKEDRSNCFDDVPYNFILHFNYDENGKDIFPSTVNKVLVTIFDSKGLLHTNITINKESLNAFQGVRFNLPPDNYSIVCWGDTYGMSYPAVEQTHFDQSYMKYNAVYIGDKAHYAPSYSIKGQGGYEHFIANIPRRGAWEDTINFMPAHRTVNVWVEGFETVSSITAINPEIEFTDVPCGYDFYLAPVDEFMEYRLDSELTKYQERDVALAVFQTPYFETNDRTNINLYGTDGNIAYSLPLQQCIDEQSIDFSPYENFDIWIQFTGVKVKVTIKGWDKEPIYPEF